MTDNPKDRIGRGKLHLHLWPETASIYGSMALLEGALKYGRSNWREAGVVASVYVDALRRHVAAWFEGEECDPDSGLPHLAHALACLAILVDAKTAGKLLDDRQFNGAGYRALVNDMTTHVGRLKAQYADRAPKHWTIADNADQHLLETFGPLDHHDAGLGSAALPTDLPKPKGCGCTDLV